MATQNPMTSAQLQAIYRATHRPTQWFSDLVARAAINSDKERIEFDFEDQAFGLAPFVRPCDEGIATPGSGYLTKWFRPAYIKMKDALNVCDSPPSWYAGERPYNTLSHREKLNLSRTRIITRHGMMLDARKEWTAWKLAQEGKYNIAFMGSSGNVIQNVEMSYGRKASLTVAPGTLWSNAAARPENDLQTWINLLTKESKGRPFICIMGENVYPNIVSHQSWNDLNNAGSKIRSERFNLLTPSYEPYGGAIRVGSMGQIDYWTHTGTYRKADGTEANLLDPDTILLIAADPDVPIMTRFHGAIHDFDSLQAVESFRKEWREPDPSAIQILTQSAPLTGTLNPNLILTAKVL